MHDLQCTGSLPVKTVCVKGANESRSAGLNPPEVFDLNAVWA